MYKLAVEAGFYDVAEIVIGSFKQLSSLYLGMAVCTWMADGLPDFWAARPVLQKQYLKCENYHEDYKYLSWVYGVDRKICHEGH